MRGTPSIRRIELPTATGSVPRARRALDELRPELSERAWRDARLLVSELVANAVEHAAAGPEGLIEVGLEVRDDALKVSVEDDGAGFEPRPRREDDPDGSGWGLHFLRLLARDWGTERSPRTKVWFEIERDRAGDEHG